MDFLLDTNIVSDLFMRPHGSVSKRFVIEGSRCVTSIIVVAEMRFGVEKRGSARLRQIIDEVHASIPIEPWSQPADEIYGKIRAVLERNGTPIGGNDLLIAAHALALDCTLVTANEREFRRVPGLRVENWIA